jgi:hypothetical protein
LGVRVRVRVRVGVRVRVRVGVGVTLEGLSETSGHGVPHPQFPIL